MPDHAEVPTIPDGLTPDELRREANRRELVAKQTGHYARMSARNELVEAILDIPAETVRDARAVTLLIRLVTALRDAQDDDGGVTNGDISMAGGGNWWDERGPERVVPHEALRTPTQWRHPW